MRRGLRYYIFGRVGGKLVALGGHPTENDARNAADKIKDWDSEPQIKAYHTTDLAVAKAQYKFELSQETGQLGISLRPIRGSKAVKQKDQDEEDYKDVK